MQIEVYHLYEVGYDDTPIYTGLARRYHLRRLAPYTEYNLVLEACTGPELCARSPPNSFRTAETAPEAQSPPKLFHINSTSLIVTWLKPLRANGRVIKYQVRRRQVLKFPQVVMVCFHVFVGSAILSFALSSNSDKLQYQVRSDAYSLQHCFNLVFFFPVMPIFVEHWGG